MAKSILTIVLYCLYGAFFVVLLRARFKKWHSSQRYRTITPIALTGYALIFFVFPYLVPAANQVLVMSVTSGVLVVALGMHAYNAGLFTKDSNLKTMPEFNAEEFQRQLQGDREPDSIAAPLNHEAYLRRFDQQSR